MSFKKHFLPGVAILLLAFFVCFAASSDTTLAYAAPVTEAAPVPDVGNDHFQALLAAFPGLYDPATGVTQPVFNLAAANVIHEEVWIEVPVESLATGQPGADHSSQGQRDLICIRISRPAQADPNYPHTADPANPTGVVQVPVLMHHSPYRNNNQSQLAYVQEVTKNHPNTEFIDNPITYSSALWTGRPYGINPDTSYYTYDANVKSNTLRLADWPWSDAAYPDPYYSIPASRGAKPIAMANRYTSGAVSSGGLSLFNYMFARGFAVVNTSVTGNRYSLSTSSATAGPFNDGLTTYGEAYEMLAGEAAIKWLNGECRGYKTKAATEEVVAYWANGDVAMTGTSYEGTTNMGVAAAGDEHLKAILPIAGISNMYEYFRKNGAVYPGNSAQGEDAVWLSRYNMSRWSDPNFAVGTRDRIAYEAIMDRVANEIDRETGDYNKFWDIGNWVGAAAQYKTAVLFTQGFDDRNVGTQQFDQLYRALKEIDPNYPMKMILHLQPHTNVWNWGAADTLGIGHKWLDRFVYGIENGIDTNGIEVWVADNVTGAVQTYPTWPATGDKMQRYYFGQTDDGGGQLYTSAPIKDVEGPFFDQLKYRVRQDLLVTGDPFYNQSIATATSTSSYNWWYNLEDWLCGAWESTLLFPTATPRSGFPSDTAANVNIDFAEILKHTDGRLAYVTEPLTAPVTLSGSARVTLDIVPDKGIGSVSAMIVDLGNARRNYATTTNAAYQVPAYANAYNAYSRWAYSFGTAETPYKVVARSSVDIQNPNPSGVTYLDTNITKDSAFMAPFSYQTVAITPGQPYSYTFTLEPRHYTFRTGDRLAVIIYTTDYKHTIRPYEATKLELNLGAGSYIDLPLMSPLPVGTAPNFNVYLKPDTTDITIGETISVDVMLRGTINYTQILTELAYDNSLLQYDGYTDLNGWVAACAPSAVNKITVRSVPTMNAVQGESCDPDVKVVTLKFTAKNNLIGNIADTAISFVTANVFPPGGYVGAKMATSKDLPISIRPVTYDNLYASVQGETNAAASYRAFAAKALDEGYPVIAQLFTATADAESKHADDEWAVLVSMGATERPVAGTPTVGTTVDNLLAAFNGETYEYTEMYPDFLDTAQTEGIAAAERIFNLARQAEQVHAGNYAAVLALLQANNYAQIAADYATVYRCVTCGEVVTALPAARCPICGANADTFMEYTI